MGVLKSMTEKGGLSHGVEEDEGLQVIDMVSVVEIKWALREERRVMRERERGKEIEIERGQ